MESDTRGSRSVRVDQSRSSHGGPEAGPLRVGDSPDRRDHRKTGRLLQISQDESIRPDTTLAALGNLKSAFFSDAMAKRFPEINWQVTAGNSSPSMTVPQLCS